MERFLNHFWRKSEEKSSFIFLARERLAEQPNQENRYERAEREVTEARAARDRAREWKERVSRRREIAESIQGRATTARAEADTAWSEVIRASDVFQVQGQQQVSVEQRIRANPNRAEIQDLRREIAELRGRTSSSETLLQRAEREGREATEAEKRLEALTVTAQTLDATAVELEREAAVAANRVQWARNQLRSAGETARTSARQAVEAATRLKQDYERTGHPADSADAARANTLVTLARSLLRGRGGRTEATAQEAAPPEDVDEIALQNAALDESYRVAEALPALQETTSRANRTEPARPSIQPVAHVETSDTTREPIEFQRSTQEYSVVRGDSLWKIAEKVYGKGKGNLYTYLRVKGKGDATPNVIHPGEVVVYHPIIARGITNVIAARGDSPLREREATPPETLARRAVPPAPDTGVAENVPPPNPHTTGSSEERYTDL